MLLKLLPEQVSKWWDELREGIELALPPTVGSRPDRMNVLLASILDGELTCWASYRKSLDSPSDLIAIVLTTFTFDYISGTKNLMIYCLYAIKDTVPQDWADGVKDLSLVARSEKCNRIIGFTKLDYICKIVQSLGGDADQRFISIPIS